MTSPPADKPKPTVSAQRSEVVVDGADGDFVRVDNGTVLPITYGSWKGARQHRWYEPPDQIFNAVFYAALKEVGVRRLEGNRDLAVLARHHLALGLSPAQVRGAYGLEKGVFGHNGRFLPSVASDSDWDRELLEARKKGGDRRRYPGPLGDDPEVWKRIEADASIVCRHKRDQANIDTEFRWIRSHLAEWPDFRKAPSRGAIKDWLEINRPGNEALKRDFLKLAWTRRLVPGDRKPKAKPVFEEDAVEDASLSEYDESLEERLGQAEGRLDEETKADDSGAAENRE